MTEELSGRRIVVPETRELGQLVRMLEELGADTVPCPMIAIRDAPDAASVEAWLRRFADGRCDDLVLMTGEGLRRLLGFARRINLESAIIAGLRLARKITRGPKPVRALREVGLAADVPADEPTTEGIITTLERYDLAGRRVGVQLYPGNANERLLKFLEAAGAQGDPVLPYVYASEVDDARVIAVIAEMAAGAMDAIAFTSAPQVRRFRDVARAFGREAELRQGLERIVVAAVGPIVAAELDAIGVHVDVTPRDNKFFMKPLVRELAAALTRRRKKERSVGGMKKGKFGFHRCGGENETGTAAYVQIYVKSSALSRAPDLAISVHLMTEAEIDEFLDDARSELEEIRIDAKKALTAAASH